MSDTEPKATAPSLREQLVAAIDSYPVACWTPGNLADRMLAVILPHGKFLGDMHRESEAEVARLRQGLADVIADMNGVTGARHWIAALDRILNPPADSGPSVAECAAADRRYWERKDAGEGA